MQAWEEKVDYILMHLHVARLLCNRWHLVHAPIVLSANIMLTRLRICRIQTVKKLSFMTSRNLSKSG